jgi:hypothetical protein
VERDLSKNGEVTRSRPARMQAIASIVSVNAISCSSVVMSPAVGGACHRGVEGYRRAGGGRRGELVAELTLKQSARPNETIRPVKPNTGVPRADLHHASPRPSRRPAAI